MKLLDVIQEDLVNYKKIAMTLEFPMCSFKCNHESGQEICQNSQLSNICEVKEFDIWKLISSYLDNSLSESVVFQGLEPFDSYDDAYEFIKKFRNYSLDDIVIYTGYTEEEIKDKLNELKAFENIIVKVGRFKPNQTKHYDEVLGVYLMSDNQYAFRLESNE